MGIHLLQTFIASLNDRSIKEQHLREFSNKKITVDISIYLYRFKEMGNLLENIYLMSQRKILKMSKTCLMHMEWYMFQRNTKQMNCVVH
jgi:hypothetical protein